MNIITNSSNNSIPVVIGLDHGFGQMKTAHTCFKTGVTAHEKEPTFKNDLLVYEGRYYTIGEEHKEFIPDKSQDQDYYLLTLAAVAAELRYRGLHSARVWLAAGLPLTWVSEQKVGFKAYLLQKASADYTFRGEGKHNPHAHILLTMRPLNKDGTWQHKTEKEYICIRDGKEHGFTAAEFKTAQAEGWEKQYLYQVGKERFPYSSHTSEIGVGL